ncbi:Sporulation related domain-containing protein [Formivibrio citricus]|uniref:Sporulation related domain-containing protein n=1 Tax=Formivibrio citricus TaxID=83765 RepID=A0A1I5C2K4_9NEIS|nr:SPOR domain-containing protein [Formivibrio citricus]SFN81215.1 Sporulation related domain-containing protein [Formivibrio citricus]
MAKNTGRTRNGNGGKGSSLLTGLVIGLLIGAVVAVGAALYINRQALPFFGSKQDKVPASSSKATDAPPKTEVLRPAGSSSTPQTASAVASQTVARKASEADRFDFYTVLPGLAEKGGKEAKKPEASQPAKTEASKAAWLQVGAFQSERDADNLKAKLALIGIEARIQTVQIADKGTWHRVRVGPYNTPADIDKARAQLQANGIESSVVK